MTAKDDNARTQAAMQRRAAERGSPQQFPDADSDVDRDITWVESPPPHVLPAEGGNCAACRAVHPLHVGQRARCACGWEGSVVEGHDCPGGVSQSPPEGGSRAAGPLQETPPTLRGALERLLAACIRPNKDDFDFWDRLQENSIHTEAGAAMLAARAALAAPLPPTLAEWLAETLRMLDGAVLRVKADEFNRHLDDLPARVAEYVQEQVAALTEGR